MLYPTNIFTSSPSSTPCDCRQRSRTLFWNCYNLTFVEKTQSHKYIQILVDLFSVSSKPFIWVGLLFWNFLILLKASPPSTIAIEESSVKIDSFRDSFPHHTLKLCTWTSLEGEFVERENFRPITSWHIILPSSQNIANYKEPRIVARFSITAQKPIEICQVSCKNQSHISVCKQWHKQSSACKRWHKWTNQTVTCVTNQTPPRVTHAHPNSYK